MSIIVRHSVFLVEFGSRMHKHTETHLLFPTDITDNGVGGWTGRGSEDCDYPFRHDLAHWGSKQGRRE